jgi:hypothetical protein
MRESYDKIIEDKKKDIQSHATDPEVIKESL